MEGIFNKYVGTIYPINNKKKKLYIRYYKKNFLHLLPKNKNARILEIGFGNGFFLAFLEKYGYANYIGIEIGKEQYEYAKKNITKKVLLVKDSFQYLEENKNKFDVIIFNNVLSHIKKEKIIPFLELVNKALVKDGIVLVKVPNIANPFTLRSRYRDFTHEIGFTMESLFSVLAIAGFIDIKVRGDSIAIPFIGYIIQFLRSFIGLFIKALCILYGGDICVSKFIIACARKN